MAKKGPLPLLCLARSLSNGDEATVGHTLGYYGCWCLHIPQSPALPSGTLNALRRDPSVLLPASKQQQVPPPTPFCSVSGHWGTVQQMSAL